MVKKATTKEPELFGKDQVLPSEPVNMPMPKVKPTRGPRPNQQIARVEPAPPPSPRSMLEVIMSAVRDPACDVEKMKALLDMQERVEERDAKKAFTRAFNALQFHLPTINKDGLIDHGDGVTARGNRKMQAKYSTYPNLMSVCRPLLKEHGFTFNNVIEPSADGAKADVVGYLTHVDGYLMRSHFPLTVDTTGKKNNQQGYGSGASYGRRYNLILLLDIVSEAKGDLDNDGHQRRSRDTEDDGPSVTSTITKAQVEEIRTAIEDAELPEERFLEKYKIDSLVDLPVKVFAEAKKDVAAFKRKMATGGPQHG